MTLRDGRKCKMLEKFVPKHWKKRAMEKRIEENDL
jgi:hypothetical protein